MIKILFCAGRCPILCGCVRRINVEFGIKSSVLEYVKVVGTGAFNEITEDTVGSPEVSQMQALT